MARSMQSGAGVLTKPALRVKHRRAPGGLQASIFMIAERETG